MRSGISVEDMDREVRPQDDLFGYVNGGWVARTQIPSDRALHGTFRILADDAEQHLRAIVQEAKRREVAVTLIESLPGHSAAATLAMGNR